MGLNDSCITGVDSPDSLIIDRPSMGVSMVPMTAQSDGSQRDLPTELTRLYFAGAWTEAERVCASLLARNPQDTVALVTSGELALARGDSTAARERLRRAFRLRFPDLDLLLRLIRLMTRAQDFEALETATRILMAQLRRDPGNFNDWFVLAQASEGLGRIDEAIAAYERACAIVPAHAGPHTLRAILLLRRAWGAPLPSPPDKRQSPSTRGRIAMTALGQMGRFGNQIFQYGFMRLYGHIHHLQVEVPDWIGRWLFDLDDPHQSAPLPPVNETRELMGGLLRENSLPQLANYDLWGHLQCHTSYFRPHQALFRALFRPGARLQPSLDRAMARLREHGRTLVAIHLRRGDYRGGEYFWPAPSSWYLGWLRAVWPELEEPLLYIASDDPSVHREFADFSPITAGDLGVTLPGAEMYPDFHIMAQADVLAISNSSFSVAAALLNEHARFCMRPAPHEHRLVPFDPWNTDVLLSATRPAVKT